MGGAGSELCPQKRVRYVCPGPGHKGMALSSAPSLDLC